MGISPFTILFNIDCLPFFCGRNHININLVVSNQAATIDGTNAFAHGKIENKILFSLHNWINDFHGSDNQGVHASDITSASFSCNNLA